MPLGLAPMCSDTLCDVALVPLDTTVAFVTSPETRREFCASPQDEMPDG